MIRDIANTYKPWILARLCNVLVYYIFYISYDYIHVYYICIYRWLYYSTAIYTCRKRQHKTTIRLLLKLTLKKMSSCSIHRSMVVHSSPLLLYSLFLCNNFHFHHFFLLIMSILLLSIIIVYFIIWTALVFFCPLAIANDLLHLIITQCISKHSPHPPRDEGDLLHIPISLEPTPAKQIEDTLRNFEVQKEVWGKWFYMGIMALFGNLKKIGVLDREGVSERGYFVLEVKMLGWLGHLLCYVLLFTLVKTHWWVSEDTTNSQP